jgi:uncharacterized glyoxalase superfamily protein PhnB
MSNKEKPLFKHVTPILCVNNVEKSLKYYKDILGFSIEWFWSEDKGFNKGTASFASVCRGDIGYFLAEQCQGNPGAWSSLFLENLDELEVLYQEYLKTGADIIEPPEDKPWGMREMLVQDLDGNKFRIGSGLEQNE